MSPSFIKIMLTGSFIALLSTSVQADVVDEVERIFDVDANSSFRIANVNGSVAINSWDNQRIKVTATITTDNQDDRDNIEIDMQQSSTDVRVETRYKENEGWGRKRHSGKVEYLVFVPKNTMLSAIDLVNGSLTIENVMGKVNAELVNGSIKAKGLASNSVLKSVNGSIKVSYGQWTDTLDEISIETVNGSIKISVPKLVDATVKAETMHGSIKTDFGLVAEKQLFTGRHLSEKVGNGDLHITMKSVNGSIKLLRD